MRHCATSWKVAGLIPYDVTAVFHIYNPSGRNYGPGVNSSSKRNEYQEYFLGDKGGRCVGLTTYHLPVLSVLKSGSLNLLEPSGPVLACNGTALLLPLPFYSEGNTTYIYMYIYIYIYIHTRASPSL